MRRRIIWAVSLLIFGHLMAEISEIIEIISPSSNRQLRPLISCTLDWYNENGINLLWWIKYNTEELLWCCVFVAGVIVAAGFSKRLMWICVVFLSYHIIDWFMLWYNYKQSNFMYWLLILDTIVSITILFKIKDKLLVKSII